LSMPLRLSASLPTVVWPNSLGREWRGAGARQLQHLPGKAARVAIDVLMPFHSMTTTDSVERISGGLAKSPSQIPIRPVHRSKLQARVCIVVAMRLTASS